MSERLLFSPYKLGRITLRSRIVMSPMTRSRSPENVPTDLVATYYGQRASAGLIVTEGTSPSPNGLGYARIPGLFSAAQVEAWKKSTAAVHAQGGAIFVQLMHTGRVGHPANLPKGARIVGPSANAAPGEMYTDAQGPQPHPAAEAMSEQDIEQAIEEFAKAAENAIAAGFDGVEIHGANGYLVEQFLDAGVNQRTDRWGGSVENRARFAIEVAKRIAARIGADRTGIRLSPYGVFNGTSPDAQTDALYLHLVKALGEIGVVYVHLVDHSAMGAPKPKQELFDDIRKTFPNTVILAGGYVDAAGAEAALEQKRGDLVAFGRPFLANPDLPAKLARGAKLTDPDYSTFYTPGEKGYTDYPVG